MYYYLLLSTIAGLAASSPVSDSLSDIEIQVQGVARHCGPSNGNQHQVKRHCASTFTALVIISALATSSLV